MTQIATPAIRVSGEPSRKGPAQWLAALGVPTNPSYSSRDRAEINRYVNGAAYFSLFSLPNPASPSTGVLLVPFIQQLFFGFNVTEDLHRFDVHGADPNADCGFRISQEIGMGQVARVSMQMTPMPNYFQAAPDRVPPPTVLLPFLSERFAPLNGSFEFFDDQQSSFRAFGVGRTLAANLLTGSSARLGAAIDLTDGTGRLAGASGTGIINGDIQPPGGFAFSVLFRIVDPDGSLVASAPIGPLVDPSDPTPTTTFLPFLSERDPDDPITFELSPDDSKGYIRIVERLRLVELSFAVNPPGLRSMAVPGAIVGSHTTTVILDLSNPSSVIPAYSKDDYFSFFDRDRIPIGSLKADLSEARLFPTAVPGLETSILRIGGVAPLSEGNSQFSSPLGMVSVNGAFSLVTGEISTLYMIRISDPLGLFRSVASLTR